MRTMSLYFFLEGTEMKQSTALYYFLGANSDSGFYSLYDQFCCGKEDYLYIIKGGPGTGKSTFMRRIGQEAEQRGLDVEYILCSGDPNSLDGVYIPALRKGWVDGTAPHAREPMLFGISGEYVDLGRFCHTEQLQTHCSEIKSVQKQYKKHYDHAYRFLHAAGSVFRYTPATLHTDEEARLRKRAQSKIIRELRQNSPHAEPSVRFLRAFTCKGCFFAAQTVNALCSRICVLESDFLLENIFFHEILQEIKSRKIPCIVSPNPLCPDMIEAVLLPQEGLGFFASYAVPPFDGIVRTIHLDSYLSDKNRQSQKHRQQIQATLLQRAYDELATAKSLHDRLERLYRPALDIEALNQYTDSVIRKTFL